MGNETKRLITLFSDEEQGGVAFKNKNRKRKIINILDQEGECTIPEIAQKINISVPTATSLLTELLKEGLIQDYGKIDASVGRRANLYGLSSNACYFIGVDVRDHYLNMGLIDFKKNLTLANMHIPFKLENTQHSLETLISLLKDFIKKSQSSEKNILSICINLTGRINTTSGYSYSFFHFSENPLASIIEKEIGLKTFLENDSRAMGYGEFHMGVVKNEKDVLFINIDYGIGMGILIDGKVYYGKSGFSGEIGHIPLFNNEIICHCGKKGCLETEASGRALIRLFKEKIKEGLVSSIINEKKSIENITLDNIIKGAKQEDVLIIELLSEMGDKLGRGLAVLINLFNAELVVLGGALMATGDYLFLPTKTAINKYSLGLVNNDTKLCISQLGEKAGIIGSGLIARNRMLSI